MKSTNGQRLTQELKWVESLLRKKGSLGILYAMLSGLSQIEESKNSPHLNFEKEFCIKKIVTRLKNSDDAVQLMDRALQFLKF